MVCPVCIGSLVAAHGPALAAAAAAAAAARQAKKAHDAHSHRQAQTPAGRRAGATSKQAASGAGGAQKNGKGEVPPPPRGL